MSSLCIQLNFVLKIKWNGILDRLQSTVPTQMDTCIPNENLTELLEFCYIHRQIPIEEGKTIK